MFVRMLTVSAVALAVGACALSPASAVDSQAAPAVAAAASSRAAEDAAADASTASARLTARKAGKSVRSLTLRASASSVAPGTRVTLRAAVRGSHRSNVKVTFYRHAAHKWIPIGADRTGKSGKATLAPKITKSSTAFRAKAGGRTSAKVTVTRAAPLTSAAIAAAQQNPWPAPAGLSITADFAATSGTGAGGIPIPAQTPYDYFPIPVKASAEDSKSVLAMRVTLQENINGAWSDVSGDGAAGTLDQYGETMLRVLSTTGGTRTFRVATYTSPAVSTAPSEVNFAEDYEPFYEPPAELPDQAGTMIRAEQVQLDWTHGCYGAMTDLSDPDHGTVYTQTNPDCTPAENPTPAPDPVAPVAGGAMPVPWPGCLTSSQAMDGDQPDYAKRNKSCPIQGKQYRIMYTTKRFIPNPAPGANGGAEVAGTEAATGLLLQPDSPNGKIVVWGHPTIGQANFCSISRGSSYAPRITGNVGGVQLNLYASLSWADQMLTDGYSIVMPDYLGVAVQGPTRTYKTYVVGQQEARDIFYAAAAMKTPAGSGWPGFGNAASSFVAIGHSQGGHAAMWAGVESAKLAVDSGMTLKGVVAAAPAADLNMVIATTSQNYAAWALGPELVQTYSNYLPANLPDGSPNPNAMPNIMTAQGNAMLGQIENYCTGNAVANAPGYVPGVANGYGTPQPTADAFSYDPASTDPAVAAKFPAWVVLLNQQTPTIVQGQINSFPLTMPLLLVQPTDDFVVVAQTNAAMQETWCRAGANMSGYWASVANSPAILKIATVTVGDLSSLGVAAGHGTPLSWIIAGISDSTIKVPTYTGKNSVMGWQRAQAFLKDRTDDLPLTPDCAATKAAVAVPSLGTFDTGTVLNPCNSALSSNVPFSMPRPVAGNVAPTVGSQDRAQKCDGGFAYGLWPYGGFIYGKAGYTGVDPVPAGQYRWGLYPYNGLCSTISCGPLARTAVQNRQAEISAMASSAARSAGAR